MFLQESSAGILMSHKLYNSYFPIAYLLSISSLYVFFPINSVYLVLHLGVDYLPRVNQNLQGLMLKNNHAQQARHKQDHLPFHPPTLHFYFESTTEPLRCTQSLKRERRASQGGRAKDSHELLIKIMEEEHIRGTGKSRPKHKKGKSMDLQLLNECLFSSDTREPPQKGRKVVVNSSFIHEMRKRNANSEMKHYQQGKILKPDEPTKKTRKKKSAELLQGGRKPEKHIIQISTALTAPSNIKKKSSKHQMQSLTLSSKPYKEHRSTEIFQDRRCKSSLKEKKNSKILQLKSIERSLPLASKLNSLYSNTTSIYNSHNDLPAIQKILALRIPTEEDTQQIFEIRQYQSQILKTQKSIKVLRNAKQENLARALQRPLVEPDCLKTEDIISSYVLKFQAQSQPEIIQPPTLEQINEICHSTKQDVDGNRGNSAQNSLIQGLEASISIDGHMKGENQGQASKLNEIIGIIERGGKNVVEDMRDKQYIIKTIKEIIQSKKEKQHVLAINTREVKQNKTNTFLDSNSINTSSLRSSMTSEADISVLNLELLDKALRERQKYLQTRLKKEIERIEDQQDGERDKKEEIERVTKWVSHQIKEVQHTRNQLWKGFNVAKSILKDQLTDKSREILRCLSEKYIHKGTHRAKQKEKKEQNGQMQKQPDLKNEQWSNLNNAMMEQSPYRPQDEEETSPLTLSPLAEQNPLHLQDLRFLTNKNSPILVQSQGLSIQQGYASPKRSQTQQKRQQADSSSKDARMLRRQRLNCESPHSDSDCQSYGAIIIQREDTFLFSSDKKHSNSFSDLTVEDKEDVCEFLFLDLCIEIVDELGKQSKVVRSVEGYIRKMRDQSKRQKGFKTNPLAIKEYLTSFINFLKTRTDLIEEIHDSLDKAMGPTTVEILRYMHSFNEEIDQDNECYVLTARIFDCFEEVFMRTVKIQRYYQDQEREGRRRMFIKNAIHIHNKAIYDAFNQTLDKDRPFGIWGEPFSWKKTAKFAHTRDARAKNEILVRRAQQTIQLGNYMCGFMADKEDCSLKDNPNVTEAYIEQIRYDRLSRLMAKELEESEERMRFFDDEQTELLVDMGLWLFTTLLGEVCGELQVFML